MRQENINENEVNSSSQTRRILAYLKDGNKITPLEALEKFGTLRLGARIADIEEIVGYPPHRDRVQVTNRSGKLVWVARYWL
jgi:hypothetical protein